MSLNKVISLWLYTLFYSIIVLDRPIDNGADAEIQLNGADDEEGVSEVQFRKHELNERWEGEGADT